MTEEVNKELDDGSLSRFALFGIHLETTIFRLTIDPLLATRQGSYAENTFYWVYPIRQFVTENCTLPDYQDFLDASNANGQVVLTSSVY